MSVPTIHCTVVIVSTRWHIYRLSCSVTISRTSESSSVRRRQLQRLQRWWRRRRPRSRGYVWWVVDAAEVLARETWSSRAGLVHWPAAETPAEHLGPGSSCDTLPRASNNVPWRSDKIVFLISHEYPSTIRYDTKCLEWTRKLTDSQVNVPSWSTRGSTIAPSHALCQFRSCQILHNCKKSHLKRLIIHEWPWRPLKVVKNAPIQ